MRKAILVSLLSFALLCLMTHTVFALRCSGRIISVGDTKWHAQDVCGEPLSIDFYQEEIVIRNDDDQYRNDYQYQNDIEKERIVYVNYEIWRYKKNRQSLPYILIFRDQVLIDEMTERHYRGYWSSRGKKVYGADPTPR